MEALQVVILALVQGLTEFLPVSSSGHLVLLPAFVDWDDQGLGFDVAVHVGTLVAVMGYFHADIKLIVRDWSVSIVRRQRVGQSMLGWAVLVGTIPAGLCGLILNAYGLDAIRSPTLIAAMTILFGLFLWWADVAAKQQRSEHTLTWSDVLIIGCAQALALIPGTSRSGGDNHRGSRLGAYPWGSRTLLVLVVDSHHCCCWWVERVRGIGHSWRGELDTPRCGCGDLGT